MDTGLLDRVAVICADEGADRGAELAACAASLRAEGAVVVTSTLADGARTMSDVMTGHGRIDVVVAIAPQTGARSLAAIDDVADLNAAWETVVSTVAAYRAALPSMATRKWGRLVCVTSSSTKWLSDETDEVAAMVGLGLLGMHKAAVADVAPDGIVANAVLRGVDADPADVASLVTFLCSLGAGYLDGVAIALDGAKSPAVY
jgi:NAD(P)-dependent dehydrogenase (short-subunit alcohol dehydrogenase family)